MSSHLSDEEVSRNGEAGNRSSSDGNIPDWKIGVKKKFEDFFQRSWTYME